MADWRKLAKALALADGKIDTKETEIIKKEIYADGKLDKSELEWLIELRNSASGVVSAFNDFFFDALKKVILEDGEISDGEAKWLEKVLYADGKIDDSEKKFLSEVKAGAKKTGPAFDALVKKVTG
jgi:uncharacterized tellurite resistance protein B-like protein